MGNRNQQSNNFIQAYNIDLIPDNADSKNIASPTHLNAFNKLVETLTTHANRQETCIGFPQAGSVQVKMTPMQAMIIENTDGIVERLPVPGNHKAIHPAKRPIIPEEISYAPGLTAPE